MSTSSSRRVGARALWSWAGGAGRWRGLVRAFHVEQPRVVLHGEAEAVVAQLLVRLAAAVELLDVTAVALEHGVAPRRRPPARGSAARGWKSPPNRSPDARARALRCEPVTAAVAQRGGRTARHRTGARRPTRTSRAELAFPRRLLRPAASRRRAETAVWCAGAAEMEVACSHAEPGRVSTSPRAGALP